MLTSPPISCRYTIAVIIIAADIATIIPSPRINFFDSFRFFNIYFIPLLNHVVALSPPLIT